MNQMLLDVPKADVVIVNPTHYAVALKWSRAKGAAPICVAKGVDEVAQRIREVAQTAGVPIHSDPPAARALHATVEIGREIRPSTTARSPPPSASPSAFAARRARGAARDARPPARAADARGGAQGARPRAAGGSRGAAAGARGGDRGGAGRARRRHGRARTASPCLSKDCASPGPTRAPPPPAAPRRRWPHPSRRPGRRPRAALASTGRWSICWSARRRPAPRPSTPRPSARPRRPSGGPRRFPIGLDRVRRYDWFGNAAEDGVRNAC
jgi:type III secretion system FlhB-like substrate exporter